MEDFFWNCHFIIITMMPMNAVKFAHTDALTHIRSKHSRQLHLKCGNSTVHEYCFCTWTKASWNDPPAWNVRVRFSLFIGVLFDLMFISKVLAGEEWIYPQTIRQQLTNSQSLLCLFSLVSSSFEVTSNEPLMLKISCLLKK